MHPLIGITSDFGQNSLRQSQTTLNEAYARAVMGAGGVPLVIPSDLNPAEAADLIRRLDGLLLSGGGDVEPWRYGGDVSARLIDVHPDRDALELELVRHAVAARRPLLGICRGCQVLNVGLGGSLYEDLAASFPGALRHDIPGEESSLPAHEVAVAEGALLGALLGRSSISVNSHHHQGLKAIASGLRVTATAPDGLVEAVEMPGHPFCLAVQWHPERLTHEPWTLKLFAALVNAASQAH